uniref:G protein-coupled receptor 139 n=1 Tax=Cyclopterus lumpus TaxID=8103 RepID=A0A8C2ZF60_CYCLU
MEHSHIFPVFSPNGSTWSTGQHPTEFAHGCPLGPLPVIYYSILLCLGLPANILTVVILSQLVLRRQKSSYNYLLALAAADILVLGLYLGTALPPSLNNAVQVLEFSSIHTSIWITVLSPLTVTSLVCHPASLPYSLLPGPHTKGDICLSEEEGRATGERGPACPGVGPRATVYILPCTVFFSLNAVIVRKLRRRRSCFRLRGYSTGKTTAILLAITSIFAVLWAPRTLMILYHFYSPPPVSQAAGRLLHVLTDLANMLALLNTGVNFFLYCFISKRFRGMAANVLRALLHCRKQPPPFYASHNFSITSSPWISPANSHCIKMLVYQYDKNGKPICISS